MKIGNGKKNIEKVEMEIRKKNYCGGVWSFLFTPSTNRAVHARNKESAKGQMEMASSWRIKKD